MGNKTTRANIIQSMESAEVLVDKPVTVSIINDFWNSYDHKQELKKKEAKNQKKKKKKSRKNEEILEMERYNEYALFFENSRPNKFNPFLHEQNQFREGNIIPDQLELSFFKDSGFFFGMKNERNHFIGKSSLYDGDVLINGISGSGKTEGVVLPTMMTWKGVQIIIDVKGDLLSSWFKLNRPRKKFKVFNPGASKFYSCGYDPFAPLRQGGNENLAGNAKDLALALLPCLPSVKDPVWITAAQNFLTSAIIYYYSFGCDFADTMATIQTEKITKIIKEVMDGENIIAKIYMSKLSEVQEKVITNIGMEISNLASLVTDEAMLKSFFPDEELGLLDWHELSTTTEPFDVILVFPEAKLDRWRPLLMLMLNQLIRTLEQRPQRTYKTESELPPVLIMIDEFPRLGKISAIKSGILTLRSRGVTFSLFVQSLVQIEETYGREGCKVIADNCAYKVVLNATDPTTQEYFSQLVGTVEATQRSINISHDPYDGRPTNYSKSINETREYIIFPHEFQTQKDIVLITPHGFCRVNKVLFSDYEDFFMNIKHSMDKILIK